MKANSKKCDITEIEMADEDGISHHLILKSETTSPSSQLCLFKATSKTDEQNSSENRIYIYDKFMALWKWARR